MESPPIPRHEAAAIVLAGGSSSRMGRDKALLQLDGRPLVAHVVERLRPRFAELWLSADDDARLAFLGLPIAVDAQRGQGPLGGLAAALAATRHGVAFVCSCDVPDIDLDLVDAVLGGLTGDVDAVVPVTAAGHLEPLFAAYRSSLARTAAEVLASGRRSVLALLAACRVRRLPLPPGVELTNLNAPEDWERFLRSRRAP